MTTSKDDLKKLTDNLKKLPDYNVLQTGQSLFTKITGIKTSSIQALEDMIKQKEESFDSKLKPK